MVILRRASLLLLVIALTGLLPGCAWRYGRETPQGMLVGSLTQIHHAVEPPAGAGDRAVEARIKITEAKGIGSGLEGREFELSFQPPDRLHVKVWIDQLEFQLGRDGQELWVYNAAKHFCLLGQPGVPRFNSQPDSIDHSRMKPLRLPVSEWKLKRVPMVLQMARLPDESVGTNLCHVIAATRRPHSRLARHLPPGQVQLWLRSTDLWPQRIRYTNDSGVCVQVDFESLGYQSAPPPGQWEFRPGPEDHVQIVALSHLLNCLSARVALLGEKIPALGPATGERRVVATEGKGRLELIDGTRVLFVKGTPEEMGHQHGVLLKKPVRNNTRNVLFGLGIGGSLAMGTWFFGDMEQAQQRLLPHMDPRYLCEMDALAQAAGVPQQEVRMANLFPELFHCSGFAMYGDATREGRLYHGRILDYFRGQGLEQNAVVIVSQPDYGHAWVNISYAGFVGSVTALNEKRVAIGEMGGRGEGRWDGKPMAELVREVMEKADTVDDALEIMRRSPRTCEYYYVISDGNTRRAVSVHATPTEFEILWAGQNDPRIPEAIKDVAAISGGDRFKELLRRIQAGYGTFDENSARDLMTRPVCMTSNIHSVLFEPETLDFWVANADSQYPASQTRYTHYNLAELLGRHAASAELTDTRPALEKAGQAR
ncbi:MAG TPA: C45 family peptidase [Verrucomicrobiae bacterium]|nr:C45 family peptidase [Verrucomicrobiae bacterium]